MNKYPSLFVTFKRVFKLSLNSYLGIFPLVGLTLFINYSFGMVPSEIRQAINETPNQVYFLKCGLSLIIGTMISCIMCSYTYNKFYFNTIDFIKVFKNGFKRSPLYLASLMIVLLPAIIFGIGCYILKETLANNPLVLFSAFVLGVVIGIATFVAVLYTMILLIQIINKGKGPWEGLKHSYQLTKGYLFKTFLLLLIYLMANKCVYFLFKITCGEDLGFILSTLIFSPLYLSMMVIHCEQLEVLAKTSDKNQLKGTLGTST